MYVAFAPLKPALGAALGDGALPGAYGPAYEEVAAAGFADVPDKLPKRPDMNCWNGLVVVAIIML